MADDEPQHDPNYVDGTWAVDIDPECNAITIGFTHLGSDGVEDFATSMPPSAARVFAQSVLERCDELE